MYESDQKVYSQNIPPSRVSDSRTQRFPVLSVHDTLYVLLISLQ